jgi:hypothetical protein
MTMTVDGSEIGECLYGGTSVSIIDYSRKERDAFGNITIIERGYSDLITYSVVISTADADQVRTLLASKRAVSAAYIGASGHDVLSVEGYLNNFSITFENWNISRLTIEVESEIHS